MLNSKLQKGAKNITNTEYFISSKQWLLSEIHLKGNLPLLVISSQMDFVSLIVTLWTE